MRTAMDREIRDKAWTATKLAVREYSKNPSEVNESHVRAACSQLRAISAFDAHTPHAAQAKVFDLAHR